VSWVTNLIQLIDVAFFITLVASTTRLATPLLLTSLGETYGEVSGVVNLGAEGMMLAGAFTGFVATVSTGSYALGFLIGGLTGLAFGFLMAFLSVSLRVNQIVSGMGITIAIEGASSFFFRTLYGFSSPPRLEVLPPLNIPVLSKLPVLGPMLFQHNIVVYLALILVPVFHFTLFRTKFGLKMRAAGENPLAADLTGVNVIRIRYVAVCIGGFMAGIGGAFLPLAELSLFWDGMTAGLGWIAIAIVMFGKWNPYKALAGALLFGGAEAVTYGLQAIGILDALGIRPEFLLMVPYVLTILALTLVARKARSPSGLGIPYRRPGA
jgi:ABC-type uncharacterized transport system permease subunit